MRGPGNEVGQAAVKRMKVTIMNMTVMPLTLGENMTQDMSLLNSSIKMRRPYAQSEPYLKHSRLIYISFDFFFVCVLFFIVSAYNNVQ